MAENQKSRAKFSVLYQRFMDTIAKGYAKNGFPNYRIL